MKPKALLVVLALLPGSALALINPKYTVVDLIRDCGQVYVLRVNAPADGKCEAEIVEALLGEMPAQKRLSLDASNAAELPEEKLAGAFAGTKTALGVMCIQKRKQDGARVGVLQVGTTWVGLTQAETPTTWNADKDPNELDAVWAGSARRLVAAIRYALREPDADFPVVENLAWGQDLALGQLAGKAHGCVPIAEGIVLLSAGGDRIIAPGKPPTDITAKLGLTSKSQALAAGDFNGDGRIDLASWDGAKLWLLVRAEDGTFGKPSGGFALPECLSLAVRPGEFVIGTSQGLTLMRFDGTVRQVAGPGGPCLVTDTEIHQVSANAVAQYKADAKPVVANLPVLTKPVTVLGGDYDTDGQLDLMVAGEGGAALLSCDDGQWTKLTADAGEFGVAANNDVVALSASDLNGDSRQAVALFHAKGGPGLFFSRGFACFGIGRVLNLSESKLPAAAALSEGIQAGLVADLNGDNSPDLLGIDPHRKIWAMFTVPTQPRRFQITVESAAPVALTVAMGTRNLGIWVLRPGEPTTIALPRAGKASLKWRGPDGAPATKDVVVVNPARVKF